MSNTYRPWPLDTSKGLLQVLDDPATSLTELLDLYRRGETEASIDFDSVEIVRGMANRLLQNGLLYHSIEIAGQGLVLWPNDPALRRIRGLSWARSGAAERANQLLQGLVDEGQRDKKRWGFWRCTHKDLALFAVDPEERRRQFDLSFQRYREAYELTDGYWATSTLRRSRHSKEIGRRRSNWRVAFANNA